VNAPTAPAATLPDSAVALLRTLVLCDLVESTALIERLGDQRAAEVFRRHDRLVRSLIRQHGGQEIDKTDGFLSMFDRPIQAVGFALEYQRSLRRFAAEEGIVLAARTGIHVGDVMVWHNAASEITEGAKPVEVEGLVKPVAARLMGLALPGQILMSGVAYTIAHRSEGELGATLEKVRWRHHGRFRFKGVPEAVPVHEVGEEGLAPLKAPAWTGKAHRETPIWRRPAMLAFEAVVVLALVAVPVWNLLRPQPAIAFAARDWVVLADLRNLTEESRFDEALTEAFRIGLEQSRHVNVLSDLKLRTTLERMQRPRNQAIDRETGAEIAVREGARAIILPSIAEVGGRVRFTAEVIDPHTQATVYSESADGVGLDSVLPSVDAVNRSLRGRLGEAIAAVSESSQPLMQVATADLDALRAFTLATRAHDRNDLDHAQALFQQAIDLDPEFARARLEFALLKHDRLGDVPGALTLLDGLDGSDRLSPREVLHLRGLRARLVGTPDQAMTIWRQLVDLYPDYYAGHGHLAYDAWVYGNRFDVAVPAIERNVVGQNPRRGVGLYLLGVFELARGDGAAARARFSASAETGVRYENEFPAFVDAAERDYDGALQRLAEGTASGTARASRAVALTRALFDADQGRLAAALDQFDALADAPDAAAADWLYSVALARYHLRGLLGESIRQRRAELEPLLAVRLAATATPIERAHHQSLLASGAWLAARAGDDALTRRALAAIDADPPDAGWPLLARRTALARAQADLLAADADAAAVADRLVPLLDGNELYSTRLVLVDALVAAGRAAEAAPHLDWLAQQRGRAYAEVNGSRMLQQVNVLESTLALLAGAELALVDGRHAQARSQLDAFRDAWPRAGLPPMLSDRADAVAAGLAAAAGPAPDAPAANADGEAGQDRASR
jgi:putative peptide modification system cyclase